MKYIHYAVRVIKELLFVIVIAYTKNGIGVIEIESVHVHPVGKNGIIDSNCVDNPYTVTPVMFDDSIQILREDGCLKVLE